jgi:2-oxoacid:acceptor oxidoreductase gamma subunit (pyruvate/2-ketoisovalerate family)
MAELLEVRWHGRGGLGAVTSAELLARAAASEGKFTQSFPSFGPERRGAPVVAFLRIGDQFIRTRTNVRTPDVVVVIDPRLLRVVDVTDGLKDNGLLIINSTRTPSQLKAEFGYKWTVASVDATRIARDTIGVPITNTAMIGAFLKLSPVIQLSAMREALEERFGTRAAPNFAAMQRAYDELVVEGAA